jgi:hypothetical protein
MADCIVDLSSKKMPGTLPFEPRRADAYKGYTKMISLKMSEKPAEELSEFAQEARCN